MHTFTMRAPNDGRAGPSISPFMRSRGGELGGQWKGGLSNHVCLLKKQNKKNPRSYRPGLF